MTIITRARTHKEFRHDLEYVATSAAIVASITRCSQKPSPLTPEEKQRCPYYETRTMKITTRARTHNEFRHDLEYAATTASNFAKQFRAEHTDKTDAAAHNIMECVRRVRRYAQASTPQGGK